MINKWIFIAMQFSHFSFSLILTNSSFLALFPSLSYAAPWPPTLVSPQLQSGFFLNFYYCDFLFSFTIWSNNRDFGHTRPRGRGWGDRHTHLWEVWCNVAWKAKRSQVSWPKHLVELNYLARMLNYIIYSEMKKKSQGLQRKDVFKIETLWDDMNFVLGCLLGRNMCQWHLWRNTFM